MWRLMSIGALSWHLFTAQALAEELTASLSLSQVEDLQQGVALGAAETKNARALNTISLEMIRYYEGWRPKSYNDPSGYCTVGYGHLIALKSCEEVDLNNFRLSPTITLISAEGELTKDTGTELLLQDTVTARLAVMKLVSVNLSENQFGALVSLVFNIGKNNFARSTLLRVLNAGGGEQVPHEFLRWSSSKGKVLSGLFARRSCEASMFSGGLGQSEHFNPDECKTLGAASDVEHSIDIEAGEQ